jgi:CRP-like cAMP-binding protein
MPHAEQLAQNPLFKAMTPEQRDQALASGEIRSCKRGLPLWGDGDNHAEFTFLLGGRLKLVKGAEEGRPTIVELVNPGELACGSTVCSYAPYCCKAVAMEETTVFVIERRYILDLCERSPRVAQAFVQEVSARNMSLCQRLSEITCGTVGRRIAILLARLAEQLGEERPGEGRWIPVALSRQDLADMCGTTIETASRFMTKIAREGVVATKSRGFLVLDAEALNKLAHD